MNGELPRMGVETPEKLVESITKLERLDPTKNKSLGNQKDSE